MDSLDPTVRNIAADEYNCQSRRHASTPKGHECDHKDRDEGRRDEHETFESAPEYAKSDLESAEGVFRYPERFDSGLEAKAFAFLSVDPSIIPPLVGLNVLQPNDDGGWSVMKARTMSAFLGCYLLQGLAHFRFDLVNSYGPQIA